MAGEIEDLLKDLRKAFIEHALQGELTHLLGYEKHAVEGRKSGNSRNGTSRKTVKAAAAIRYRRIATARSSHNCSVNTNAGGKALTNSFWRFMRAV